EPHGIRNLFQVIGKRITIRGFIVFDFEKDEGENFRREVSEYLLNGDIVYKEDIAESLDDAPEAFVGLLQGERFGKVVIKIADLNPTFRNLHTVIGKRITIRGSVVESERTNFQHEVSKLLLERDIAYKEDVSQGLDTVSQAFIDILYAKHFGKAIIRINDL
ncbi:hypothetical protein BGZ92_003029, partial [Podila epicladia]